MPYRVREATLRDIDALVRHRIGMFTDMGLSLDAPALEASFRAWLTDKMPAGTYRAWLIETDGGVIAAGGGISILPWPPGRATWATRSRSSTTCIRNRRHRAAAWRGR
jgi:hypothetical protein